MKKQKNLPSIKQNYNNNKQGLKVIKINIMIIFIIAKELYPLMIKESNKHLIAKDIIDLLNLNSKLNSETKLDNISVSIITKHKLYSIKKKLISETKD